MPVSISASAMVSASAAASARVRAVSGDKGYLGGKISTLADPTASSTLGSTLNGPTVIYAERPATRVRTWVLNGSPRKVQVTLDND